ncbi:MAG: AAA family ATPase [Alphaproteobacteria bacterium]|jgi:AAA+ ATPase superfamily predicted ATPase|nr:AAA family ATPase [Alphaproteobacteria bacterium]MBP9876981.1 AAA family ATPase [Alphaproteobacteria bacterium]
MENILFIGRKEELKDLTRLFKKNTSSLVVIQGRRRIGKSRLVEEFGKNYRFFQFSGIPPASTTTEQSQRDEIMEQFCSITGFPNVQVDDWSKFFALLARETQQGKVIILLDEISWMGSKDPDFLGKLKNAWDLYLKKNPELILVLCGSISTWIEENILSSTGFMGRISMVINLKELTLPECFQFLTQTGRDFEQKNRMISDAEMFKILSITGGVPRYLEEVQMDLPATENIKRLCFSAKGILFREFNDIFSDLFTKKSEFYKQIVGLLVDGVCEYNDICDKMQLPRNGHVSGYLDDLIKSGFITRDYTWHLSSGESSRLSHYRLSDNYLRFYMKYVDPNHDKIISGKFEGQSLTGLPGWDSIMGLQFENLVLNNRRFIWEALHLYPQDIQSDNPFFQRKTRTTAGCQIDYLIQSNFNILYVCEIKFSKNAIGASVIREVQAKIDRLNMPKGFSCIPILIHVNGVKDSVIESRFFKTIIDFGGFLKK